MKKSLLLIGLVSLSSLSFAGTKSYEVVLDSPAKVGALQLGAGDYRVKVDGGTATFTDTKTNKSVSTAVKVETNGQKFAHTAVDSTKDGAADRVESIELGGSTTKLAFSY
ncbi:MAG: hypothetical protein ABSH49_15110 [Bryobacteraceae bacterium]|jgi:hypothetical protein